MKKWDYMLNEPRHFCLGCGKEEERCECERESNEHERSGAVDGTEGREDRREEQERGEGESIPREREETH